MKEIPSSRSSCGSDAIAVHNDASYSSQHPSKKTNNYASTCYLTSQDATTARSRSQIDDDDYPPITIITSRHPHSPWSPRHHYTENQPTIPSSK